MNGLRAQDALSSRIPVVGAESRPADMLGSEASPVGGDGGRATHVAVLDEGRFCGLVGINELMRCPPGWIFGDLVSRRATLRIAPQTPLDEACEALVRECQDAAAVLDDLGAYLGAVTLDDISRRLAESRAAAAAISRESLLAALEHSVIIAVTDLSGTIVEANDAFCRISGYSREELIGASHRIVNSGRHSREFWAGMFRTVANGDPWRDEVCNRAKDGTLYWVDTTITPAHDEAGKISGYVVARVDITERKRADLRLRESEHRLDRVLTNIHDALIVDDLDGRLVYANRGFFQLFGIPEQDPRSIILEDYVPPEWRARLRDRHDRRVRGEAVPDQYEYEGMRADGTRVWLEVRVVPIVENGRITGTQSAIRDITDRKAAEARLIKAERREALATLTAGIAHEFNSMLLAASTHLYWAVSDPAGSGGAVAKAAAIIQQAQALSASLLELFAGPEQAAPPVLPIGTWLPECARRLAEVQPSGLSLHIPPIRGALEARADPFALEQVLRILLTNAADATAGPGEVRVSAAWAAGGAGPGVEIRVSDQGHGIPEEDRDHVFEPFFTTRKRSRRSGLGLAIASRLVEQAGGSLSYEPNEPVGSTFVIRLLATREQPE